MHVRFALLALLAFAVPALGLDEPAGVTVGDVKITGRIEGQSFSFGLELNLTEAKPGATIPVVQGDVVLENVGERRTIIRPSYDAEKRIYSLTVAEGGARNIGATFAARAVSVESGAWREVVVALPSARMRTIEVTCDRTDLEVQFPGALKIERKPAGEKLVITALLAPGVPFTARWKPQVQQLEAKLVFSSEANTIATVTAGAMKIDTLYEFIVTQGRLSELTFNVPAGLSVTQVRGQFIRDWQLKPGEAGKPATLTVALNRPQMGRYGLQIMSESVLAPFPTTASLPVIEPVGGIRAGGGVTVGTNSAIALVVKQTAGLSQINGASFPRVLLNKEEDRPLPGTRVAADGVTTQGKAFYFTHATTPYQMTIALADIVPTYDATQTIVVGVTEEDLIIEGRIDLEVRDAPLRDIVLDVPAGFVVADVSGQMVEEFTPRPLVANQASRAIDIRFKQPVIGRTTVAYKLELGKGPLGAAQTLQGIAVRGAGIKLSFVVVAADQGVAIDTPQATNMADKNTAAIPRRVAGAQYAYSFRAADWVLQFTARKKPAAIRVESFHLVTLSERIAYGNIAFNYVITGSPVDELSFRVPPSFEFVDIISPDVRSVSVDPADKQLRRVKLKRKVIDEYTLGMTFTLKYKHGDTIEVGSIQCEGAEVATQTGYIAVASHLNLEVDPVATAGSELRAIENDELPGTYQLLVNAPILRAFTFIKAPHVQKLTVRAFERVPLLPVVIEVTDIHSDVFVNEANSSESRTIVRYRIKNSSRQFLSLKMPQGAKAWQARVGGTSKDTSTDSAGNLLIPIVPNANPNEPITVEVEYGMVHGGLGWSGTVELAGPTTDKESAVSSTYTNWTVTAPAGWAVQVRGSDTNLQPQPRGVKHGNLGIVMSRAAGAWGWAFEEWGGAFAGNTELPNYGLVVLLTIVFALSAVIAVLYCAVARHAAVGHVVTLALLVALVCFGVMAIGAPQLANDQLQPDDLRTLVMTQTVTMNSDTALQLDASVVPQWRQHATFFGGIVVPVLAALALVAIAVAAVMGTSFAGKRRVATIIVALVLLLMGLSQYLAFVPAILHLFTWVIPATLLAFFLWRSLGRPMLGMPDVVGSPAAAMIALTVMLPFAQGASSADAAEPQTGSVLSIAPKEPVFDRVEAALKADGDHVEIDLSLRVTAEEPVRVVLMDQAPIVLTPDNADAPVRIEAQGRKYYLVISKPGTHDAAFKFLSPLRKPAEDQSRAFAFPLPMALTNRVTMTIPAAGLDVYVDQAMRMTKEEADGKTIVKTILGPGDDIAIAWKPRAREASLEKTSFYSQVITAARLDASLIEARHLVKFQIAQGELRDIRLLIPQNMTVTTVQGRALGAWRFDPVKHELEVRLSEAATGEYTMALITQISQEKLPYDATIAPIIVPDAVRHSGILGLLATPAVQLTVSKGPATMNVDDFAREADALLRTFPGFSAAAPGAPAAGVGAVRFAYRTTKAEDAVTAQAVEVKPELRADERATFAITDDRLLYNGGVVIDVSKAGVFNAQLRLPAGYEIDMLTAPQVSHWDDTVDAGVRTVLVHFREKFVGQVPLKLVMSQQVTALPGQIAVPRVEVAGAIKHTGQITVAADRGVNIALAPQREGISEISAETESREQGVVVFKLLSANWSATVRTEVVQPRVTVEFLHVAKVSEGLVRHTHHLQYTLQNAGSKFFEVQVPKGAQGVMITGPDIARREPTEPGGSRYRVELNRKRYDPYPLTVSYDTLYKLPVEAESAAGTIVIDPVTAHGVDQQRGHVVVLSMPRVQLTEANRTAGLQSAEPRTIPKTFGTRNLASAAFCLSSATADYALTLTAQRHKAAQLQQADALQTMIHTVVADTGDSLTKVWMQLRVVSKQHLETTLPPGAKLWTLLVNGKSVTPSIRRAPPQGGSDVHLIPLGAAAGTEVTVEIVYAAPKPAEWSPSNPVFTGPMFDLPLKNIIWQLVVPEHYRYNDFKGTMTVNTDVLQANQVKQYGLRAYDAQVNNFNLSNTQIAQSAQAAGERLLRDGDQLRAQQAFEAAVAYSSSALNEDARVKLHQFNSDKALVGLVGSRQRLREQADGAAPGAPGSGAATVNTEAIERIKGSLSKADSENLGELTRVWTAVQEKAAGESVQLAINMPYRGRVLEFTRTVKVDPKAPLQIEFTAEPEKDESRGAVKWWIGGLILGFGALYLLVTKLVPMWTSLPDALRGDEMEDDDDEVIDGVVPPAAKTRD